MSVTSVIQKIEGFFRKASQEVASEFDQVFGKQAGEAFSAGAKALLHTAEGQLAVSVVESLQSVSASGSEKRAQAFSSLDATLKSQGKTVTSGIINLLIEVAVAAVQAKFIA